MDLGNVMNCLGDLMIEETIDKGFVRPFVGSLSANSIIDGYSFLSVEKEKRVEQFFESAKKKLRELVDDGASIVVVGIGVTLYPSCDKYTSGLFDIGGPGDGIQEKNKEGYLMISGEEAFEGVVVFGANVIEQIGVSKLFVIRKNQFDKREITLEKIPKDKLKKITCDLFSDLQCTKFH